MVFEVSEQIQHISPTLICLKKLVSLNSAQSKNIDPKFYPVYLY